MTSPGDCQIQGPQPCLETGAGEGGRGRGEGGSSQAPQLSQLNLPTPAANFCHLTQQKCSGSKFWGS